MIKGSSVSSGSSVVSGVEVSGSDAGESVLTSGSAAGEQATAPKSITAPSRAQISLFIMVSSLNSHRIRLST